MKTHFSFPIIISLLLSLGAFISLSGCTNYNLLSSTPLLPQDVIAIHRAPFNNLKCPILSPADNTYRLGAGDEIVITVYNEENLSGKFNIPNFGSLNLPLIGETILSGCTFKQAEELLSRKYAEGYLVNPIISVSISKYRPFYIIGEVQDPGQYDYIVNMNILQAVALAGGFTYRANRKTAKVLQGYEEEIPVYNNTSIEQKFHPGDIIFIKERFF